MNVVDLTMDTLGLFGIEKLTRIDKKYCEVIIKGKSYLRNYYMTNNGVGHFYMNDTRYRMASFIAVVPKAEKKEVVIEVKEEGRAKEINFGKKEQPKEEPGKIRHPQYETIKTCINNDIPVYLVGEAGTGKNFTLQEIANDLNLEFYFTNSVQQEYKITGFIDAGGTYHETEFYNPPFVKAL